MDCGSGGRRGAMGGEKIYLVQTEWICKEQAGQNFCIS